MNDKLLEILASSIVIVALVFIINKLYYYQLLSSGEHRYPLTSELAVTLSYITSVAGDIEVRLPANIVYDNSEGDLHSAFATELKINNEEKNYKVVYGVCYYKSLEDAVGKALVDAVDSAISGSFLGGLSGLLGTRAAITISGKATLAITGGQMLLDFFAKGWLYEDPDFEKAYVSSLQYFENEVADSIRHISTEDTAEKIANYAIIGAVALAVAFDGLGLAALAVGTIAARIFLPILSWTFDDPDPLENCWYGTDPKSWNFIKMKEDIYFWNPKFILNVEIAKKEKNAMISTKAPKKDNWIFINPSPIIGDINSKMYAVIYELELQKEENKKQIDIRAFVEIR